MLCGALPRGIVCPSTMAEPTFLPEVYHAKGVSDAPADYSPSRKRHMTMRCQLSRPEEIELPSGVASQMMIENVILDNSHHAGTRVGRASKGWFDPDTRSYHVEMRLYDNPEGRAVRSNMASGAIRDISLTTLELREAASAYLRPPEGTDQKAHEDKHRQQPARIHVVAIGLCHRGAREGTMMRKQIQGGIHSVAAALLGEHKSDVEVYQDPSCAHFACDCHTVGPFVMASNPTPPPPAEAAPVPMSDESPPPAAAHEDSHEDSVNKSNLSGAEKIVIMQILKGGRPVPGADVPEMIRRSNLNGATKQTLLDKITVPPAVTPAAALARPATNINDEEDNLIDSKWQTPLDRTLARIGMSHERMLKDDKDEDAHQRVLQSMIPLIDILKCAGTRDLGGSPLSVSLLHGILQKSGPAKFHEQMAKLAAPPAPPQPVPASANSAARFKVEFASQADLDRALRFLAATESRPSPTMDRQASAYVPASTGSSASYPIPNQQGKPAVDPTFAGKQRKAEHSLFDTTDDEEATRAKNGRRDMVLATMTYGQTQSELAPKYAACGLEFMPMTGALRVPNSLAAQATQGLSYLTFAGDTGPMVAEMMLQAATMMADQSSTRVQLRRVEEADGKK